MPAKYQSEMQQLEALRGQRLGPYLSHNAVNATQIWQWCSVMGDRNALYIPGSGQLAPPAMVQVWTMRDFYDNYAPGSTNSPPYRVFDELTAMGYPANVAVSYDINFFRDLRVGERARHYTSVETISPRKTTALGAGYFVTERVEYQSRDDDPFAEARITYFQYMPMAEAEVRAGPSVSPVNGGSDTQGVRTATPHAPEAGFRGIAVHPPTAGDILPALAIPITRRLIVAGALASQDFTPVHHSEPAARAAGMPDIFMNILTTCGLSVRYLTDWAGCGSRLRQIRFKLMAPNLPGDIMHLHGAVSAVNPATEGVLVDVEFSGRNSLGIHISGTAVLALPNTTG